MYAGPGWPHRNPGTSRPTRRRRDRPSAHSCRGTAGVTSGAPKQVRHSDSHPPPTPGISPEQRDAGRGAALLPDRAMVYQTNGPGVQTPRTVRGTRMGTGGQVLSISAVGVSRRFRIQCTSHKNRLTEPWGNVSAGCWRDACICFFRKESLSPGEAHNWNGVIPGGVFKIPHPVAWGPGGGRSPSGADAGEAGGEDRAWVLQTVFCASASV